MFYWILLALAIVAEITGTLSLKWASQGDSPRFYFNDGDDFPLLYFARLFG